LMLLSFCRNISGENDMKTNNVPSYFENHITEKSLAVLMVLRQ